MTSESEQTAGAESAKRIVDFVRVFDANLEKDGFVPEARRSIIGILLQTHVDSASSAPKAAERGSAP